jgi:hypothetical protein
VRERENPFVTADETIRAGAGAGYDGLTAAPKSSSRRRAWQKWHTDELFLRIGTRKTLLHSLAEVAFEPPSWRLHAGAPRSPEARGFLCRGDCLSDHFTRHTEFS